MQKNVRYCITITGYVQGVGYRYFCYKKANLYGVKGYVKNLYNGDVELEIEGDEGLINDYIKELKTGPQNSFVKSLSVQKLEYSAEFEEFRIE
ncbi:MAG TPA: acylphosphatase [Ignavibacteria bacterium]